MTDLRETEKTAVETAAVTVVDTDGVRTITINRPRVRNAVNGEVATLIDEALTELDRDPHLTVGIVTGAGGYFSAGMDLRAFLAGESPSTAARGFAGIVEAPSRKPLIAAVEGFALAGGFEIVLACDLIVSSHTAIFSLPEVKRGLVAAGGGLLRLPERIPYHIAMELALTGEKVSAERVHELGLVNALTEPGSALDRARELAADISANGPLAVAATKQILQRQRDWPSGEAFDEQRLITTPVRNSADAREGALAFTEKRSPKWRGE